LAMVCTPMHPDAVHSFHHTTKVSTATIIICTPNLRESRGVVAGGLRIRFPTSFALTLAQRILSLLLFFRFLFCF
jgi:hypothetical protein